MSQKQQINNILAQAKKVREQEGRTSSVILENYLYYQYLKISQQSSSSWMCGICSTNKAQVNKTFKNSFKKMNRLQKARFYLMNIKNVGKILETHKEQSKIKKNIQQVRNTYQYELKSKTVLIKGGYKYKKWSTATIQIFQRQKLIRIVETKEEIDLQYYLIRRSKNKDRLIIVFEPIIDSISTQFRMSQSSIQFEDFQNKINQILRQAHYQKVKKILYSDGKLAHRLKNMKLMKSSIDIESMDNVPFTLRLSKKSEKDIQRQNLRQSLMEQQEYQIPGVNSIQKKIIQQQLVPEQFLQTLSTYKDFQQAKYGVYYDKSGKKVRKIFNFPKEIPQSLILYVINDIRHAKKRKDSIIHIKNLKCLPSEQTGIFQQINHFGQEDIEFVYFRHFFCRNNSSYYIQKSIQMDQIGLPKSSQISRAKIQYCLWRVRTYGNQIELLVEAEIIYDKRIKNAQQITSQYIGEFVQYINQKCIGNQDSDYSSIQTEDFENQYLSEFSESILSQNTQDFITVNGSFSMSQSVDLKLNQNYSFLKNQKNIQEECLSTPPQSGDVNITKQQIIQNANLLTHKFPNTPLKQRQSHYLHHEVGHPIWGQQWIINDQGYLLNVNEEKIKMQSSVLKLVVQRMGRNLLSGKSILNMSLPIQIFGTDSNLQRLAKGYSYAPRFIQKAANLSDPVERIKNIMCFALGFSISYIQMQKPFNPILGQTYQGLVDGCPVYGEQTSHHPPISSLFMKGRGYQIYGSFQAKVDMGVNSASGINQGFNHIIFDNYPGIVKFNGPPGQISGLVYGERKLALIKKSYFIDEQNRLFMQVNWGKDKNGKKDLGIYQDYFSGKIRKVRLGVNMNDYKKLKESNFQDTIGTIYGRVNSKVYFEGEQLFDICKDLPYRIEDYVPCLQSDSRMRKDISHRKNRDFVRAQQAKQQLENIQRKDRKLRKDAHN